MKFKRRKEFQRNERLESLLKEINGILRPVEEKILKNYRMPKYPIVLIVGCARCGATLMMQWLARTGGFAYPTNLLSRFFGAPYIGALIQQLLTSPEFNFNNEILDFNSDISFSSNLGKTKGALAPNEFWYFWRRFFHYGEIQHLDEQVLEKVDAAKFVAELAAIEAVFDKSLALKSAIINWNIPYVSSILEKVLFIHLKRHPLYNAQSLLEARITHYSDQRAWYSFKPTEYSKLKELDPFEQVAGQVYFTNCAIETGLNEIDTTRRLQINYEDFCASPEQVYCQIVEKLAQQGYKLDRDYTEPEQFRSTNQIRLSKEDFQRIVNAYEIFSVVKVEI